MPKAYTVTFLAILRSIVCAILFKAVLEVPPLETKLYFTRTVCHVEGMLHVPEDNSFS